MEAKPRSATRTSRCRFHPPRSSFTLRMIFWSAVLPGKVQQCTGSRLGDRHRGHHLGQVVTVILGTPQLPVPVFLRRLVPAAVAGRCLAQPGGHLQLPAGRGPADEDDAGVEVRQMGDRPEDLAGDLIERVQQEVHRHVGGVVAEGGAALDRSTRSATPPPGGQLRPGLQRLLRR